MPSMFGRRSSSAAGTAAAAASAAAAATSASSASQPQPPQPPPLPSAYANEKTAGSAALRSTKNGGGGVRKREEDATAHVSQSWIKSGRGEPSVRSISGQGAGGEDSHVRLVPPSAQSRFFSSSHRSVGNGSLRDSSADSSVSRDVNNSPQASPGTMSTATFATVGPTSTLASSAFPAYDQRSVQSTSASTSYTPSQYTATFASTTASPSNAASSESGLRETLARRSRCLAYARRCLSAAGHPQQTSGPQQYPSTAQSWLDTVRITRRSLEAYYNSDSMRKRAGRYYVAGCSLAPAMELSGCEEFARAVLTILNEAESFGDGAEKDRTKVRNFFKSSIRGAGATAGHAKRMAGLSEFSTTYDGVGVGGPPMSTLTMSGVELVGTHVPFALDAIQTMITFLDLLQEVYCKLLLLSTANPTPARDYDGALNGGTTGAGDAQNHTLSATTADVIGKVDAKVKKILSHILKELDALARHLLRQELASVDPQMARELGSPSLPPTAAESNTEDRFKSASGSLAARHNTLRDSPFNSSAPNLLTTPAQINEHASSSASHLPMAH